MLYDTIRIHAIEVYNNVSGSSNRSKAARFTAGNSEQPLGGAFEFASKDYDYKYIYVGAVVTNFIRLNISSSYGSYVGAGMIKIYATKVNQWPGGAEIMQEGRN